VFGTTPVNTTEHTNNQLGKYVHHTTSNKQIMKIYNFIEICQVRYV